MGILSKRFKPIGLLSISTALAMVVVAAASSDTQAQMRMNSVSIGPRGGMGAGGGMSMGGSVGGFRTEPRFQRLQNDVITDGQPTRKGKGKTAVATGGDRPGHRPPGKRPGGTIIVPVVTGVGVVTTGPTGAGPAQPPGGGTTFAQRGGLYLPPPNALYVKDEVLLEFAGQVLALELLVFTDV